MEFDVKLGYIADKIQQYHESKNIVERQKKLANLGVKVFLWSVSYTHLDVYKRQRMTMTLRILTILIIKGR